MADLADRASRVCEQCKIRKKACDKRIPSCGYCFSRGLTCNYIDGIMSNVTPVRRQQKNVGSINLDADINNQVNEILASVKLTSGQVEEQYFRSFHRSLPVVLPRAKESQRSAEAAILLLAMTLISQHLPTMDVLYSSLYQLYVLIQDSKDCISLLQIEILKCAYEYARGWIEKAYVSVGACVSRAQLLGIDQCKKLVRAGTAHERWNLWWGVLILKRSELQHVKASWLN